MTKNKYYALICYGNAKNKRRGLCSLVHEATKNNIILGSY